MISTAPCSCDIASMALSTLLQHSGPTCGVRRTARDAARCSSSAPPPAVCFAPVQQGDLRPAFQGQSLRSSRSCRRHPAQRLSVVVLAIKDGATLDRCGPAGWSLPACDCTTGSRAR